MNPVGMIGKLGLLAALAAWPVSAQQPTARDSAAVGCYVLSWTSESSVHAPAPDTIALTLLPGWRERTFAVRGDAAWEGRNRGGHLYWQHLSADTVLVVSTDGFSGVGLRLVPAPAGLRGFAKYGSDELSEMDRWPTWKVDARRTACLGFR